MQSVCWHECGGHCFVGTGLQWAVVDKELESVGSYCLFNALSGCPISPYLLITELSEFLSLQLLKERLIIINPLLLCLGCCGVFLFCMLCVVFSCVLCVVRFILFLWVVFSVLFLCDVLLCCIFCVLCFGFFALYFCCVLCVVVCFVVCCVLWYIFILYIVLCKLCFLCCAGYAGCACSGGSRGDSWSWVEERGKSWNWSV